MCVEGRCDALTCDIREEDQVAALVDDVPSAGDAAHQVPEGGGRRCGEHRPARTPGDLGGVRLARGLRGLAGRRLHVGVGDHHRRSPGQPARVLATRRHDR